VLLALEKHSIRKTVVTNETGSKKIKMGIFDRLFGKKERNKDKKITQEVAQTKTSNSLNQFTKEEQSDLRIYAFIRCLGEMMNADGAVDDGEIQFLLQFSIEARKKLSKPYDIGSKEGKFVWGNNYKSVSTNRKNFISVIKTYAKKDLEKFFEKIIVMAVADRNLDNRESKYLIGLYADIYDVSKKDAKEMAGAHLKKLRIIK